MVITKCHCIKTYYFSGVDNLTMNNSRQKNINKAKILDTNQRPPAEHGPFEWPSSYLQLCWWSLIGFDIRWNILKRLQRLISGTVKYAYHLPPFRSRFWEIRVGRRYGAIPLANSFWPYCRLSVWYWAI